jgi:hypothetical protein
LIDWSARKGPYLWLVGILSVYAVIFLIYAETQAFAFDESYHLMAARLIDAGRIPYIDFCFPQTPLNAYWNAGWMQLLGQNWHVPHAFAALFVIAAVFLTADFLYFHFPVPSWRLAVAIAGGLSLGLNKMVFEYGPLAQAYGICLFLLVASFRVAIRAVERRGPLSAAGAGLLAGAAAACSLLSAAGAPVLLVWMWFWNRSGSRWQKGIAFCAGAAIPFGPILWLLWLGPRQTWFNLFQYHLNYRALYWPDTTRHDLEVLTYWIDSGQCLLLGMLLVAGLIYIARGSAWPRETKAQFYLSGFLALGLAAEAGRAHPTFSQYFLFTVPFLAIPAMAGMYRIGSLVFHLDRPALTTVLVAGFAAIGLGKATYYEIKDTNNWGTYEKLAAKVDQVTPRNALLFADEPIYFLTKRLPPPGYELYYTHEIKLPPADAKLFHILYKDDLKKQLKSGMFGTAYNCDDDEIEDYGLKTLYKQHVEMNDCSIFWDFNKK